MNAYIYQVNVKPQREGERGLPKHAVESARVTPHGIIGDFNRYRQEKLHGSLSRALLIMPLEMIETFNQEGWPVQAGDIGENITTKGVAYSDFVIGARYQLGEIEVEISERATPCGNLKLLPYIGTSKWQEFRRVMTERRGYYAKVLKEGQIQKNDLVSRIF
ncbi:MAG: hypothetical protein QT08_C0010G0003 [archaeon GW2011_AR17]|nr:MAG: hypothetical protein QT08_C0010G0003 [archaeon GW2011_AR17]MBS3154289.1 MOSC domain-containing protein [Candidatus Woesearchaeota archaeon]HIH15229.1 MOSC domain-containing protein [Nanoarchaeota archaeon]HIH58618.1 MOSC domain-containing protein [Nanoarchaeota archaeon]HII13813.1 MOSC domain-containing protein [Nanoarchaeota archaeon]